MEDVSIVIAASAGQGIQTVESLLVAIFKKAGFHVYASKEYESRVRGGSNTTELRVAGHRVAAFRRRIDILIPFTLGSIEHVRSRISDDTVIIADKILFKNTDPSTLSINPILLPFREKAMEIGNWIYANVVAVGTISALFGIDQSVGEEILNARFSAKGEQVSEENLKAFRSGCIMGAELQSERALSIRIPAPPHMEGEILMNGNEAVALGAIAGGCNFISAYPMSPSTGVLDTLASLSEEFGIVVDQAEDEIAAMNKAIGAWYAGARAIVSTSGGGFALMTEGLSLAGMTESPLVVHLAQRPGPATGLPTRTAQEDLNHAIYSGHGEFCRLVFAPGTIEQAFHITQRAFQIADALQIPVFVLTDQDFVDSYYNIPRIDVSDLVAEHGFVSTDDGYRRYELTADGLSPRGVPGLGEGLVRVDSDEHDEQGHITEDMDSVRPAMVEKRVHKRIQLLQPYLEPPTVYPHPQASSILVCWGSNYQVVKEALDSLGSPDLSMVHFHNVFPLHPDTGPMLSNAGKVMIMENNATGQFANLLRQQTGYEIPQENRHLRYSGKPWSVEEVVEMLKKEGF
ncbi:MAG: 2-oxoacid:acceptor oxidoreductase subunit alpha [Candidatus Methanomethylophilaceae archaeon]|nr:2-oxoacid:acceptor oxidoreductase subunit alpha [Candidatus Methanomethylophilaceae archaeon]